MWLLRMTAGAAATSAASSSCFSHRASPLLRTAGAVAWLDVSFRGFGAEGGLSPPQRSGCRALHCSGALGGSRNLLRKFLSKKKKKFWYESPSLSSHLTPKPSSLANTLKLAPPKKGDSTRKKVLNVLLFKAVRDVLSTCDAGQEVYDLCVELSKASLTSDFSICRIYWRTTGNIEQDDHIEKVLQKSAPRIRHILITYQVMGNVPSIVFVRDKEDAVVKEIERLLAIADMGPEEGGVELVLNDVSKQSSTTCDVYLDSSPSSVHANLFGIDHEALNKQILEYKRMKKDKEIEGVGLSEQQEQQLAEIRKQKKMRWKKTKKPFDDDITPQKYLMDKYNEAYWDHEVASSQENQLEHESDENDNEVEIDSRTTKVK
ncbi:putative ribosome-binding factor A, mitochondrial [Anolis carolinensis]|uniref:Ribosome binding factor A n=1 Tax=Anolis carolinensis TaxID=28377 RepID=G1K9B1_ANOCA|nr:PREDICTED: putative ribosome-binding factor A, mitochondrial [Anolis carolinensis]|eukprot:XP_003219815.2 PREDICTED: putative ribosome-binding factor A, mitochondrial [Anolis carolinensis]